MLDTSGHFVAGGVGFQDAAVPDGDLLLQHVAEGVDDAVFGLRRHVARLHREDGIEIKVVSTDNPAPAPGRTACLAGWANLRSSAPTQRSGRTLGERCAARSPTC